LALITLGAKSIVEWKTGRRRRGADDANPEELGEVEPAKEIALQPTAASE